MWPHGLIASANGRFAALEDDLKRETLGCGPTPPSSLCDSGDEVCGCDVNEELINTPAHRLVRYIDHSSLSVAVHTKWIHWLSSFY
jgi:hypothetical protein